MLCQPLLRLSWSCAFQCGVFILCLSVCCLHPVPFSVNVHPVPVIVNVHPVLVTENVHLVPVIVSVHECSSYACHFECCLHPAPIIVNVHSVPVMLFSSCVYHCECCLHPVPIIVNYNIVFVLCLLLWMLSSSCAYHYQYHISMIVNVVFILCHCQQHLDRCRQQIDIPSMSVVLWSVVLWLLHLHENISYVCLL